MGVLILKRFNKRVGLGSISFLLCIIGILFGVSFRDKRSYGDIVLKFIGLNPWSNGNNGLHYTVFYSLIFFIPALIIGHKFKNSLGATVGKIISLIMSILILFSLLFIVV